MKTQPSIIHLGLYGKTAAKTIKLLVAGLREGIDWKEKDAIKLGRHFTGRITDVIVDPSGEITLSVRSKEFIGSWAQYNKDRIPESAYAKNLDVAYIKNWFADQLRQAAAGLRNDNKFQLHPASKTSQMSRVWEALATADGLTGTNVEKKWGKAVFDKVVGVMADPIKVEIAQVIAEETKRISKEYKDKHQVMHMRMLNEIESVRQKYKLMYAELGKQERAAITAMKKQMMAA